MVQHVYRKFGLSMCKRTHVAVVATIEFVRELLAEFSLVLFRVVEVFDAVVGARAVIPAGAGARRTGIRTHFGCIGA